MTKHEAIDQPRLKAAIRAIEKRKRPDVNQIELAQRQQIVKLRRDLKKRLQSVFVDAGIDLAKIDQILVRHQSDVRRAVEGQKKKYAKEYSGLSDRRKSGLENRKKAREQIAGQPYLIIPIPLFTAVSITTRPAGILNDSHIEPGNNWAKMAFTLDGSNQFSLNFYFAWQNPSNEPAVITCNSDLVFNGIVEAMAKPGIISTNYTTIALWAELIVYVGEIEIEDLPGQWVWFDTVKAAGGPLGEEDLVPKNISRAVNVSADGGIQVPGGEIVVFQVTFVGGGSVDDGEMTFDFDFDPANFKIACPVLNVDLLWSPSGGHRSSV